MIYFMYFLLVFSSIFQDFFLVNIVGEFGRSITALLVIPMFIIYIIYFRKYRELNNRVKTIELNRNLKILIVLAIYLLIINILSLLKYLFIDAGNIQILDENVIIQTVKGYIYFFNITLFVVLMYNLQIRLSKEEVFKPFAYTFIFLFLILIIELATMPNALPFLHSYMPYYRVRLTTSESSWTSSIIIIYFVMSYYYYRNIKNNKKMGYFTIVVFLLFLLTSRSKGLIITALLTALIMMLMEKNNKNKWVALVCVIIAIIIFYPNLKSLIINDLQHYTSIVTRVYTIVMGIVLSIVHPFGTGNALYLLKYPVLLENSIGIFDIIPFRFNLTEIYSYINATTSKNLGVKSAFIQYGMFWGIVGSIVIVVFFIRIYQQVFNNDKSNYKILKFGFINIIILLITVTTWDIKYEIWSFFSVMIYMGMNNDSPKIDKIIDKLVLNIKKVVNR